MIKAIMTVNKKCKHSVQYRAKNPSDLLVASSFYLNNLTCATLGWPEEIELSIKSTEDSDRKAERAKDESR